MRKNIFFGLIALFALMVSCDRNDVFIEDSPVMPEVLYAPTDYNLYLRNLAVAVNEAINSNESFRKLVKVEVDKKFDGDFNVLFTQIIDLKVDNYERREDGTIMPAPGNITVADLLNSSFQKVQERVANKGDISHSQQYRTQGQELLGQLKEQYSNLQIAVPFLEEQLEDENYIPAVVFLPEEYSEQTTEYLPGIKYGQEYAQTAKVLPDSACIVISNNERIDFDRADPNRKPNIAPPPTPISLTGVLTDFGISLNWTMPTETKAVNTFGYKVYRKIDNGDYNLLYTNNSHTNRSFIDANLELNKIYYYYVEAYNDFGSSSKVYNGNGIVVNTRPGAVQTFDVNPVGPNTVRSRWNFGDSDNNGTLKMYKRDYWNEYEYPQTPFYSAQLPVTGDAKIFNVPAGAKLEYMIERTTPIGTSAPKYDMLYMPYRDVSKQSSVYIKRVKISDRSEVESWRGAPEYKIKMWRVKNDGTNLTQTEEYVTQLDCDSKEDNHWEVFNRQMLPSWQPGADGATWYDRLSFYVVEYDGGTSMTDISNGIQALRKVYDAIPNSGNNNPSEAKIAGWIIPVALAVVDGVATNLPQWVKRNDEKIGWTYLDYYEHPSKEVSINAECGDAVFTMEFSDKPN